jgi:hypothetical protein
LTDITSRLEVSNSSQAPRFGISLAVATCLPVVGSVARSKYTPGERTNCETTTRSAPLMTNVPSVVMIGKSPMKISESSSSPAPISRISPVSVLTTRNFALMRSGEE